MKILYLHQYFTTPGMVGGTRSYEFARRLAAAGHEVHMVTSDRCGVTRGGWREELIDDIRVHWIGVRYANKMGFIRRIVAFLTYAMRAGRKAAELGGEVVFATSTPLTVALPGVFVARRLKVPMILEVRDLWPDVPIAVGVLRNRLLIRIARWLEKFAYQNAAAIVALSPGIAAAIKRSGYCFGNVHVIPNGCDIAMFSSRVDSGSYFLTRFPFLKHRMLVVYTGAIGKVNNLEYMAEIAAYMSKINVHVAFAIVGEGGEFERLKRKSINLGVLETNLWILPPIAKSEVPAFLSIASVATSFVVDCPAMWDNSANKFFDALAAGIPVVINHRGWLADLLEQSGAGLVIPPRDACRAASQLSEFLMNKKMLVRAAKAARQLAEERFDRDKLAEQLLEVIEGIATGKTLK